MAHPEPRANPDLVGHAEAERTLLDAHRSGRLHHAWMISGQKGIGKATLAFRFARWLLAGGEGGGEPGGGLFGDTRPAPVASSCHVPPEHPVFRRVAAGGHADLLTVERQFDEKRGRRRSEIVVEDVRAIGAFMTLTAAEGGWRIAVIDAACEMNRNAANAVLKVLEEPPPRALLLLVTHNPGRLLPTIRSRCRRLQLRPLDEETMAGLLARYQPELAPDDTRTLARLAEGSIGRALALAGEQGLALHGELLALLGTLPTLDIALLHALAEKIGRAGAEEAFETATGLLRHWLERLVIGPARGDIGGATPEERRVLERLAGSAPPGRWIEVWDKATGLIARVDGLNLERKQVLLNLFLAIEATVRP